MVGPIPARADPAELAADIVARMHAVTRRVRRHARDDLDPLGLTPAQVRALRTIDRLGGPAGARMGSLAAALDVVPRSATDVVAALEARDLVARAPDPDDGRAVIVALTPAGHRLLTGLGERHRTAAADALAGLTPAELAQLASLLARATGADPGADHHR